VGAASPASSDVKGWEMGCYLTPAYNYPLLSPFLIKASCPVLGEGDLRDTLRAQKTSMYISFAIEKKRIPKRAL
jgi:hypothetical protein